MGLQMPSVRSVTEEREGGRAAWVVSLASALRGIVFPTLLIFLPIAIFPNDPCRKYVPSKGRRALLWLALDGDGTVLLYRC